MNDASVLWLCRAGQSMHLYSKMLEDKRLYLCWDGYNVNLAEVEAAGKTKEFVFAEKKTANRTSIGNWASQIRIFCKDMKPGDLVLIPYKHSAFYTLARITGDYEYNPDETAPSHHSHTIEIIREELSSDFFTQEQKYSLDPFRTIFRFRTSDLILSTFLRT